MPRDTPHFTVEDAASTAPDMGVLRLNRRPPPDLPLEVFGPEWKKWIEDAADAAACPIDYVVAALLPCVSALIGNARWARGTIGWEEPPHLWCAAVGDSGSGKSPGSDMLMRDVLPEIERRMVGDFPDRQRDWQASAQQAKAAREIWEKEVRHASKQGAAAPLPPDLAPPEPQKPRLRQHDVTIEKVASLLATAAPKGLLICRDEIAGWMAGMTTYNEAGRSFWIEAYGGRPYRVERQKSPEPIEIPRLAVAVMGGTQPEKLAELMRNPDDGLLSRIAWFWPDPVPFTLARRAPDVDWAIRTLDRLRLLDLIPADGSEARDKPVFVPLVASALPLMEAFGREMQERQAGAGGLMRSAYGKARGLVLRLSLVLEFLHWCGKTTARPIPDRIGEKAFLAAATLVADYLMPMAERVYGDAGASPAERDITTLARWIAKDRPNELHVRTLQRDVRLPGMREAAPIHAAAAGLIEANWLAPRNTGGSAGRPRESYTVNPAVFEESP